MSSSGFWLWPLRPRGPPGHASPAPPHTPSLPEQQPRLGRLPMLCAAQDLGCVCRTWDWDKCYGCLQFLVAERPNGHPCLSPWMKEQTLFVAASSPWICQMLARPLALLPEQPPCQALGTHRNGTAKVLLKSVRKRVGEHRGRLGMAKCPH